jgi:hypothetical protein
MDAWKAKLDLPRTSLTTYQHNQRGQVKRLQENQTHTIKFKHDQRGRTTKTITQYAEDKSTIVENQFDDLGRKTKEILGEGNLKQETSHIYHANQVATVHPNGRIDTQIFNAEGLLANESAVVANQKPREYQYNYNAKERVEIIEQPNHQKMMRFYDAHHRVAATVSALGIVSEVKYDQKNRYHVKTEYANPIDAQSLYAEQSYLASFVFTAAKKHDFLQAALKSEQGNPKNRHTYVFNGLNDQPRFEVDAENYLIEYCYNSFGKITHTIRYADKITEAELTQLKSSQDIVREPDRAKDRIQSNFYDQDQRLLATQDPAGYLTEFARDGVGNIQEAIHFKQPDLKFADDYLSIKQNKTYENSACFIIFIICVINVF